MVPQRASGSKRPQSAKRKIEKQKVKPYSSSGTRDALDIPGVQKIKSSMRQTRRLLGKDNLAADVRVETERRLKSLEADLEVAERRRKERAFAIKYHKVKFFERKKVVRKIKQLKKELAAEADSKQSNNSRENELFELRVDLNYILHYPKLERYVSLFPSSEENEETIGGETSLRRESLRKQIRGKMEEGEISVTPELDVQEGCVSGSKSKAQLPTSSTSSSKGGQTMRKGGHPGEAGGGGLSGGHIENDDFFNARSDSSS